ncbi:MAG TPA: hypothetical protein ENH85_01245 [Candidatus Scalindua sp.]|nr:hypothetical protein [Candidatus Scalindua sp.]
MIEGIEKFSCYAKGFKKEFDNYILEIIKGTGVKAEDGYACYVKDNIKISKLIPKNKIVVDVGCSFGLQHILYKNHKKYIGIQKFKDGLNCDSGYKPKFKIFTKNAQIIEGFFKDVYKQLRITEENKDDFFGIANHSLWHDEKENNEDIETFKRSFPKNYYATDFAGKEIKYNNMAEKKKKTKEIAKTTKKTEKSDCDHEWISNPTGETGDKRYICSKGCGATSA